MPWQFGVERSAKSSAWPAAFSAGTPQLHALAHPTQPPSPPITQCSRTQLVVSPVAIRISVTFSVAPRSGARLSRWWNRSLLSDRALVEAQILPNSTGRTQDAEAGTGGFRINRPLAYRAFD